MSESTIGFILFFIVLNFLWLIRILFPHFAMHFFAAGTFSGMGINDPYFTRKCKHTQKEIDEYYKKSKAQMQVIIPISICFIVFSLIMEFK